MEKTKENFKRLNLNKQLLDINDNFIQYMPTLSFETKAEGYYFKFRNFNFLLTASNLRENIQKTKSIRTCTRADVSWSRKFYLCVENEGSTTAFSDEQGLDVYLMFDLVKRCCEVLNLTLVRHLDEERIKLNNEQIKKKNALNTVLKIESDYLINLNNDQELMTLFKTEFDIDDFIVINHFLWAMGDNPYHARDVVDMVKKIWMDLAVANKSDMTLYLALISKYTEEKMRKFYV